MNKESTQTHSPRLETLRGVFLASRSNAIRNKGAHIPSALTSRMHPPARLKLQPILAQFSKKEWGLLVLVAHSRRRVLIETGEQTRAAVRRSTFVPARRRRRM